GMLRNEDHSIAFRHELARLAVEESMNPHRRLALHRQALAVLEDPPAGALDLARLAHHAEAAGENDAVLPYATAAGARAASLAARALGPSVVWRPHPGGERRGVAVDRGARAAAAGPRPRAGI